MAMRVIWQRISTRCASAGWRGTLCALLVLASLAACNKASAHDALASDVGAANAELSRALHDSASWATNGREYTNQRFSPLSSITGGNVDSLGIAWIYHTGLPHAFETTPLVIDGTMYITTPLDHVVALDAETGSKKWEYTAPLNTTDHCCGPVNRGVAYWGGRLFLGTLDARLVALDARDGHVLWSKQMDDPANGYSITAAPVAVNGMVISGISGGEYGVRGYVTAYDARTGAVRWRFYTVPAPGDAPNGWWGQWRSSDPFGTDVHRDIAQEKKDSAAFTDAWKTGGAPVWQTPAVDVDRKLVIFSTGNPAPDVDGSVRPGDNLYANSIVGLDLETGKLKWYMQAVPHDQWDYDLASPVVLFDAKDASGKTVPAAAEAAKTGWVYVVNRETGAPLRRSDPFVVHQNMFNRPTATGAQVQAGAFGGSEWSPAAYSPQTGLLYVLGVQQPLIYKVRHEDRIPGAWWVGGAYYAARGSNQGNFSALDPSTGHVVWQVNMNKPLAGGALATGGGLVFVGTSENELLALDAKTGDERWRFLANAGVNAPPITYQVGGTQYLAVAVGGNWIFDTMRGDELIVFKKGVNPTHAEPGAEKRYQQLQEEGNQTSTRH